MSVPKNSFQSIKLHTTEHGSKNQGAEHAEHYWRTADHIILYSQAWLPVQKPRAIVNLIHGLGEHSSRYASWSRQFTQQGYLVRSFDLRGHGRSEGKRGYSKSYQQLISDVATFVQLGNEEFGQLPAFIYGHGLGGNLVLNYAMQNYLDVHGLIITSPWLELVNKPAHMKQQIAEFLGNYFPGIRVNSRLKPEELSRELRVLYEYTNDPLVHDRISLRLATEIMAAGAKAAGGIYKINVPLLVMHGNADGITSCKSSRNFVRHSGERTKFIEWEGGYHELHMDLDREKVFNAIIDWLEKHI